jgi:hypothetical protein
MKKYLVLELDQYAGNVDELVSVALTGCGADRYGCEQALITYNNRLAPLVGYLPIEFCMFATEYGESFYCLDHSDVNKLRFCIDSEHSIEEIQSLISIWEKAYGNSLEIVVENYHDKTVKIKIIGVELVISTETRIQV